MCKRRFGQLQDVRATEDLKFSHRPDGRIADVLARLALAQLRPTLPVKCSMYVPPRPDIFPWPRKGKLLTHLFRLACTTAANALFNYSVMLDVYVPRRDLEFPIAPMGKLLTRLPRLTLAQLRTLRSTTECTCRKDTIALMGISHVLRLCLQGGGVFVQGGTVAISSCTISGNQAPGSYVRAHAQKFPSP